MANPVRTCVGCRRRFPQGELDRFVRSATGWHADGSGPRGKQAGRGAYLCSPQCIERAAKNKRYPGLGAAAVECGLIRNSCK
ncbi:MAG: YlxR family protein [Candidatus Cybelea sp.]